MISAITWVPAGVANPNPKRYELSPMEQQLMNRLISSAEQSASTAIEKDENDRNDDNDSESDCKDKIDENNNTDGVVQRSSGVKKIELPIADASVLPADLMMDDYSDDDDDNDNGKTDMASRTLLHSEGMHQDSNSEDDHDNDTQKDTDDDDNESVDIDNLQDVPDTREYMPVNIEGLQAMNIGGDGKGSEQVGRYSDDFDNDNEDDEDDSEKEDIRITPDDAIAVVAKTEDDFPTLEVQVYDTVRGNLYVHHDIPLPAFPICIAHGRQQYNGTAGNFCAVGTFLPGIDIWNLDVLNAVEPSCVLGGTHQSSFMDELLLRSEEQTLSLAKNSNKNNKNKNNKRSSNKTNMSNAGSTSNLRLGSHTDAVLSLSWNTIYTHVLASGSADTTVKLWDVTTCTVASTLNHHRDKVQSLCWNPTEPTLLATGSFDRSISILDARTGENSSNNIKSVRISADCEAMAWDPNKSELLTVVSEDGVVACWDVRKFQTKTPVWTMIANEFGGINDLSYNVHVPGLLATCSSINKTVSLWDTYSNNHSVTSAKSTKSTTPTLILSKDMCSGKLYSVSFYPSLPWVLACGGTGNQLAVWDLSDDSETSESIRLHKRFDERIKQKQHQPQKLKESNDLQNDPFFPVADTSIINDPKLSKTTQENKHDHVSIQQSNLPNPNTIPNKNQTKKKKKKRKPKVHKSGL